MNFQHTLQKYKNNRIISNLGQPHTSANHHFYKYFIIIPSYCENLYIHNTLESITRQNKELLSQVLVVIVINNSKNDKPAIKNNNRNTYIQLLKKNYIF